MSPQAQRNAIAEACGWMKYSGPEKFQYYSPRGMYAMATNAPDYINDLNAMHEAERVLDANQTIDYACYLTRPNIDEIYNVMPRDLNYHVCFPAIHARASQRAEAFLKTIGKWDDSK